MPQASNPCMVRCCGSLLEGTYLASSPAGLNHGYFPRTSVAAFPARGSVGNAISEVILRWRLGSYFLMDEAFTAIKRYSWQRKFFIRRQVMRIYSPHLPSVPPFFSNWSFPDVWTGLGCQGAIRQVGPPPLMLDRNMDHNEHWPTTEGH